tara:strand:+ start:275 stop:1012 length:738 start_codon:yes stop_codon:yes gene_type:complete
MTDKKVTFVLTSCGRNQLLDRTLKTFFKFNNYKIEEYLLVEDSTSNSVYEKIKKKWGKKIKIIFNNTKKGQIKSIIDTYKLVKTPYIFHCEDDWIYTRNNFIEDSLKILESDDKIIQVWLESKKSASRLDIFNYGKLKKIGNIKFREVSCKEGWEWGHFSFRPGIKRIKDYNLINGYNGFTNELDISVKYKKLGYYTVIIENPAVEDIGDDFHQSDPTRRWPKRRKTNAPTGFKRLWGHIKRLKF